MKKLFLILGLLFAISPAFADPATYYVPPPQLGAALQIMDSGFANIFAIFRNGTGSFSFDPNTKTLSNFKLAIDANSLVASSNESQRDLANFLGAFQFSEIRITAPDSTTFNDNKAEIKATVMIHGTNKPVTF